MRGSRHLLESREVRKLSLRGEFVIALEEFEEGLGGCAVPGGEAAAGVRLSVVGCALCFAV